MNFSDLPRSHYGAIYADPPWSYEVWNKDISTKRKNGGTNASASVHFNTMAVEDIGVLPISEIAAKNCALFIWITWPTLPAALEVINKWGFIYKTCAFSWIKANNTQIDLFREDSDGKMGMGYWTRANNEACLLATRGKPKRLHADVRQAIIEPRREHSRKPDCVVGRIEQLVAGPYIELFARTTRPGWDSWGDQTEKFVVESRIAVSASEILGLPR